MAAWMALDRCDEENGCMRVVPGSHQWPLLCPTKADTTQSFTDVTVPIPEGQESAPVEMEAGDVLFFNGTVVHGSFPNTSKDRFRRALIGHYIEGNSEQVATFYDPVYTMDGKRVQIAPADAGGRCGVWVDADGKQEIEMQGTLSGAGAME
jgi:ectoine hydroxylase-related dioxygenase (phytanoyl-CoA dioxygenase family)